MDKVIHIFVTRETIGVCCIFLPTVDHFVVSVGSLYYVEGPNAKYSQHTVGAVSRSVTRSRFTKYNSREIPKLNEPFSIQ